MHAKRLPGAMKGAMKAGGRVVLDDMSLYACV
jgi:hypothetical protein